MHEDDVSHIFTELAVHVDNLCTLLNNEAVEAADLVDCLERLRVSMEEMLENDQTRQNSTSQFNEHVKLSLTALVRCLKSKMKLDASGSSIFSTLSSKQSDGKPLKNSDSDPELAFERNEQFENPDLKEIKTDLLNTDAICNDKDSKEISIETAVADQEEQSEIISLLKPASESNDIDPEIATRRRENINLSVNVVRANSLERLEALSSPEDSALSTFSPNSAPLPSTQTYSNTTQSPTMITPVSPNTELALSSGLRSASKRKKATKKQPIRLFLEFDGLCKRVEYTEERTFECFMDFAKTRLNLPKADYIVELRDPEANVFYIPEKFAEIKDLCHVKLRLKNLESTYIFIF